MGSSFVDCNELASVVDNRPCKAFARLCNVKDAEYTGLWLILFTANNVWHAFYT
jgi:hypothetical protein